MNRRLVPAVAVVLAAACGVEASPADPVFVPVQGSAWWEGRDYVPSVPVHETRASITVMLTPPSPLLGSEGEAGTPRRGLFSVRLSRLSDERNHTDARGDVFRSDGEVQLTTLEYVSPRLGIPWGTGRLPFHLGATLTGYSLHDAWFDGLRNFIEEDVLTPTPIVAATHDLGGRELSVTTPAGETSDLLGSAPLLKAKGFAKFPLRDLSVGRVRFHGAASIGLTAPAFGNEAESGSSSFQPEGAFAWSAVLRDHLRWTGAFGLALSGDTERCRRLGLETTPLSLCACSSLEWWFQPRLAVSLGLSWNSAVTRDSTLSTDLDSLYVNVGVLYRLSPRTDLHMLFSENPETPIKTTPHADYTWAQKDADFVFTLGLRVTL